MPGLRPLIPWIEQGTEHFKDTTRNMKRLFAIPVVGAALILLVAQGTALAGTKLLQLSSDPFTNATSQHRT